MEKFLKPSHITFYILHFDFFFKILFASTILHLLFCIAWLKPFLNTSNIDFRSSNSCVSRSLRTNSVCILLRPKPGSCYDIAGIVIYYFIIWDLFLVAPWAYEASVKLFQTDWNYCSFLSFFERWGWTFHLCYVILAIIIFCFFCGFCCFQYSLGLKRDTRTFVIW